MAYATQTDIVTLYSLDALFVADRDGDGEPDTDAVSRALTSASSEMNTYLAVRYSVPIEAVSDTLIQLCVDIALYRLASSRDVLSEEHRRRYEDAIKLLEKLGSGKASLDLPAPIDPETGDSEDTRPKPIVVGGPERLFSREKMRGL